MSDQAWLSEVTLAILAGGQSTRMGQSKAKLEVAGVPILQYLLEQFDWPGPTMLVTAPGREHPPAWQRFTWEVVDPVANQGPLRGLLTALENAQTPTLAVMTVDMPCITPAQLRWLIEELSSRPRTLGIMASRLDNGRVQIEPFPSAFRASARQVVAEHLAAGAGSVYSLSRLRGFVVVSAPAEWPQRVWTNLNTPADLDCFLL